MILACHQGVVGAVLSWEQEGDVKVMNVEVGSGSRAGAGAGAAREDRSQDKFN